MAKRGPRKTILGLATCALEVSLQLRYMPKRKKKSTGLGEQIIRKEGKNLTCDIEE